MKDSQTHLEFSLTNSRDFSIMVVIQSRRKALKNWLTALKVINVLLVFLIIFLGYHVYQQKLLEWEQERIAAVISKEEKAITDKQSVAIQSGMIGEVYVSAAYPLGEGNKPLTAVETEMKAFIAKEYGDKPSQESNKIKRLAFVDSKALPTALVNVTQYQISSREYENTPKEVKTGQDLQGKSLYVKADGTAFLASDIVNDQAFLMERLVKVIEKQLSDAGKLDETAKKQLESLKARDPKMLTFELAPDSMVLSLPETIAGMTQAQLPFSDLFDHIKKDYLQGEVLKAYQTYQEEKERLEKERALAAAQGRPQVVIPGKVVALTFDDGPNPATTPIVLDTLAKYKAKATFYVLGSAIPGNEAILKRAVAEGHEIGNHTWDHPSLTTLAPSAIKWQIDETNKVIQSTIGSVPKTIRPPYGATNATVQANLGMYQMLWDVDTLDWKNRNTQAILANVQSQLRPGAVILMHDIHATTAEALPVVMEYLVSQGYSFVTVSELYGY